MSRRFLKPSLGVATACAVFGAGVPAVLAATDADTGLSPSASKIALAKSTKLTILVKKDQANVLTKKKLTCTTSTASLLIPSTGFKFTVSNPKFGGCTDTLKTGDKDTIKAGGKWTATYIDASDASGEVHGAKGDKVALKIPKNGMVAVSTFETACAIFVNPKGTEKPITGAYNDATGQLKFAAAPITFLVGNAPHQTKICPVTGDTGTAVLSATYVASPVVSDN
jgi:hypothetical protein